MHRGEPAPRNPAHPEVSLLRPYLLASGRHQPIDQTLEVEAQVATNSLESYTYSDLTFERRDIVMLCRETKSVAEIAAILRLHIGVARVLVADLAQLGYLTVRRPSDQLPQDLHVIERVIRGLEALR
ncbi:MAG: DUF742 domain-containing protein [Pseudonocardia sp.]|nr:DUF742 domain-containing protein [Pseudonocardia sp.]